MMPFLVGFFCAALAGMGVGGGGLLVIWLALFCGMEQLEAQGINLLFFLFSSGAAMLVHLTHRRLDFRLIAWLIFFGGIGAVLGSMLAHTVEPGIIRFTFGILLLYSGIHTLFKQ